MWEQSGIFLGVAERIFQGATKVAKFHFTNSKSKRKNFVLTC